MIQAGLPSSSPISRHVAGALCYAPITLVRKPVRVVKAKTRAGGQPGLHEGRIKNEINGPKSVQFAAKPLIEQMARSDS